MEKLPVKVEGMIGHFQYLIRDNQMGYLCGYLLVPQTILDKRPIDPEDAEGYVDCHGGITYHDDNLYQGNKVVFMKRYPGYWIGFDCAHFGDAPHPDSPAINPLMDRGTYKDLKFVFDELVGMARQLDPNFQIQPDALVIDEPDFILDLPL